MSQRRQSWRFLTLPSGPRRKRRKEPTTALLTWDAIRTLLELVEQSADVCPPLKSAVGAVGGLCNLADASRFRWSPPRLAASDANTDALGLRVFTILKTIHNSIDLEKPVPQDLLHSIVQFEQLLIEIQTAMEVLAKENHFLHVLRLRRNESQLVKFTARLELLAEEFTVIIMALPLTFLLDLILYSIFRSAPWQPRPSRSPTSRILCRPIPIPRWSIQLRSFAVKSNCCNLRSFFWPDPTNP
ncbi:hypothetical protein B0H16DRAFT_1524132 [Mycena metata]|uniref:Uncharacterized protein n=1 Tax=Mycena metata TaxID=1033252 RepID=A0AAD7JIT4_9AGAR|nr:hypothetical protein B0H16DRAFT_1524132 [Mycena metata]